MSLRPSLGPLPFQLSNICLLSEKFKSSELFRPMDQDTGYSATASPIFSFQLLSIAWHWKTPILVFHCTSAGEGHVVAGFLGMLESKSNPHSSQKAVSRQQPTEHSYRSISFSLDKSRGIPCGNSQGFLLLTIYVPDIKLPRLRRHHLLCKGPQLKKTKRPVFVPGSVLLFLPLPSSHLTSPEELPRLTENVLDWAEVTALLPEDAGL